MTNNTPINIGNLNANILLDVSRYDISQDDRYLVPFMVYQHNDIHYGFADHDGNVVIPAVYDKVFDDFMSEEDLVRVGKRFVIDYGTADKPRQYTYFHCGLINSQGNELIPCNRFWELYLCENLPVIRAYGNRQKGECALLDLDGKTLIPYGRYSSIEIFHKGFSRVQKHEVVNGKRIEHDGLIDANGVEILPLGRYRISSKWYENPKIYVVDEDRKLNFSMEDLNEISHKVHTYESIRLKKIAQWDLEREYKTQEDIVAKAATVTKSEQLRDSQILLEEGLQLGRICRKKECGNVTVYELKNGMYGVANAGRIVVPFGKYAWIDRFDKGLARVHTPGETGRVMHTSAVVNLLTDEVVEGEDNIRSYYARMREEHPELFAKWGIINEDGEEVLPVEYDDVWNFAGKYRSDTRVEKDGEQWEIALAELKSVHSNSSSACNPITEEIDDESFSLEDCYDYEGYFDNERLDDAILDGEYVPEDW